jgi:predicted RNA binding protein YcfA (HicA-like mRNA interferase family)
MKRRQLIKILEDIGCILMRHGSAHDWYVNEKTKAAQPVPGHNEINDNLAKTIIKKLQ